jgi:hypothetical protein
MCLSIVGCVFVAVGVHVQSDTPYPPSSAIARLEWAPVEAIVRRAKDSDNLQRSPGVDQAPLTVK